MVLPFCVEEALEINSNFEPIFNNNVLIIDNWYKNLNYLQLILANSAVPKWKSSETGKNFVDYYDCRLSLSCRCSDEIFATNNKKLTELISYFFHKENLSLASYPFDFNFFRHKKNNVRKNLQMFPHTDPYINCIVYIDNFSNGGTAFYDIENLKNEEHKNLMYDISSIKLKKIIPAKPNRLVIFEGNEFHGGYIDNHNVYFENWRINQIIFFQE